MSLPRELMLRRGSDGFRLVQRPVQELRRLRGQRWRLRDAGLAEANQWLQKRQVSGGLWEIEGELDAPAGGEVEIELLRGSNQATVLRINPDRRTLSLDRTRSGRTDFHPKFKGAYSAPLPPSEPTVRFHLFVDTSSVEVFAGHGETVITALALPETSDLPMQFKSPADSQRIRSLNLWKLTPAVPIPTLGASSP